MPVHGQISMLYAHKEIAMKVGIPEERIILVENGQVVRLTKKEMSIDRKAIPANFVMVDGLGIGDVGSVVLRDRQQLAEEGMFVVISVVDSKTGRVIGNPDIISRGFVYLREEKDLMREARKRVKGIVEKATASDHPFNEAYVKEQIRDKIGQFLFQRTERRPMVLPVLIEV
jgi:ribonuclease J